MTTARRIMVCFHDSEESGASLWLRNMLRDADYSDREAIAVFPSPSRMESVVSGRVRCHTLCMDAGDLLGRRQLVRGAMNRIQGIAQYRKVIREENPHVVYVNSSVQIAPMIAAWLERRALFVHVREGWRSGRTFKLKRFAVRRFAQSVAFDASQGMRLFGPAPAGRVWEVSPNGVAPEIATLKSRRGELRREFGYTEEERVVAFLGTLCQRKGLHDLLEVWPSVRERFPMARLLVAGGRDPDEKNTRIKALENSNPEGVRYIGFSERAVEILALADYFVLPSYGEAMPISISEAMMCGTPVIARSVGDVSFQIGEERGYLFAGDGPAVLQSALIEALSDPTEAALRAAAARLFADQHLVNQRQYEQIFRLCDEALRIKSSS